MKRSTGQLAKIGKEAVEYLLDGANFWKVNGAGYRVFQKRGRFKDARKDFKALRPANVRISQGSGSFDRPVGHFRAIGTVGDRQIQIIWNSLEPGIKRLPLIIINNPGYQPIQIIYKK